MYRLLLLFSMCGVIQCAAFSAASSSVSSVVPRMVKVTIVKMTSKRVNGDFPPHVVAPVDHIADNNFYFDINRYPTVGSIKQYFQAIHNIPVKCQKLFVFTHNIQGRFLLTPIDLSNDVKVYDVIAHYNAKYFSLLIL